MNRFSLIFLLFIFADFPLLPIESIKTPMDDNKSCDLERDSLALVNLYNATNGASWRGPYKNWLEQPIREWEGLCWEDGCITTLDLDGDFTRNPDGTTDCGFVSTCTSNSIKMTGEIPDLNLQDITDLNLANNRLTGTIPDFSHLVDVKSLTLLCNRLSGKMPPFSQLIDLESISLKQNNLTGSLPDLCHLSKLQFLFVGENNLEGTLPDFSCLPSMKNGILSLTENNFTFEDIIPNFESNENSVGVLQIAPQNAVSKDTLIKVGTGRPFSIDLGIDSAVTTNIYSWTKDSVFVQNTTTNKLFFPEITFEHAGIYRCSISNSIITPSLKFQNLTLESGAFTLAVCESSILEIDTILCPKASYTLNGITYNAQNPSGQQVIECGSDSGCDSLINIKITYGETAVASNDTLVCENEFFLQAMPTTIAEGKWIVVEGGATLQDEFNPDTYAYQLTTGINRFIWALSTPTCPNYDMDTVTIISESIPQAKADAYELFIGAALTGNFLENDFIDLNRHEVKIVVPPTTGDLLFDADVPDRFTFTPEPFYRGLQKLAYTICNTNCPVTNRCSTAEIIIQVLPETDRPNVITPNGDGFNEVLVFPDIDSNPTLYANNTLTIFNQWGQAVFKRDNYQNNWEGKTTKGKPLAQSTYYYIFEYADLKEFGKVVILK